MSFISQGNYLIIRKEKVRKNSPLWVLYLILFILTSCFGGQDTVEFKGINPDNSKTTGAGTDSGTGPSERSIVSALSVGEGTLEISGENLDLIEELSLYGEDVQNENTASISSLKSLKIISQTATKIIATGDSADIALYFDGRYDLIRRDFNTPVEDAFPFVIVRKEQEEIDQTKVNEELQLEPKHLIPSADDKDVLIFSAALNRWTTGPITGQLEFLGPYDSLNDKGFVSKLNLDVKVVSNGTVNFLTEETDFTPEAGQYFIISTECSIDVPSEEEVVEEEAPVDDFFTQTNCPFGGEAEKPNLIEGRFSYRQGDWLIFDGTKWHYINNRGEVDSFNGRTGLIESCPNINCPNVYDYNWKMINKKASKLSDIADVPEAKESQDGFVLKVIEGALVLAPDNSGLTEITSATIADGTLVDEDFASGLEVKKFSGLQEELDGYVEATPTPTNTGLGTAKITGDLNFGNSQFLNVGQIVTTSGLFSLTSMRSHVDEMDLGIKLLKSSVDTSSLEENKKYFLSTDAEGALTWRELTTENIPELLEGASTYYFDEVKTQKAIASSTLQNMDGDIESGDTLQAAFRKLGTKITNFLSQTLRPELVDKSITFDKLKIPRDGQGNIVNGFLYLDATLTPKQWTIINVSGFNFLGELNPSEEAAVNTVIAQSTSRSSGDFFVMSTSGVATGLLSEEAHQFNSGDWIVWDGSQWRKIDYRGKVVSIFGNKNIIEAGANQYDWQQVVVKPYEISKNQNTEGDGPSDAATVSRLSDIADVTGTPTSDSRCCVLRWSGTQWQVSLDNVSNAALTGTELSGLVDIKFSPSADIEIGKINNFSSQLATKLNKSTPQSLTGALTFNRGSFINVSEVSNGMDKVVFDDTFVTKLTSLKSNLQSKMNALSAPVSGSNFLAADLSFVSRDADRITEDSGSLFFTDQRVMDTSLSATIFDGVDDQANPITENTEVTTSSSFSLLMEKLIFDVENRFATGVDVTSEDISDGSIEPRHLSLNGANVGDHFYFGENGWELKKHTSSIRFIGTFSSGDTISSSPRQGDYYIISDTTPNVSIDFGNGALTLNKGDWVMSIGGVWKKITNASPVTSFSVGADDGAGVFNPTPNDYTLSEIEMSESRIGDLSDVSGIPAVGSVLKWNGARWEAAVDESGAATISGADIPEDALNRSNYQPGTDENSKLPFNRIDPNTFPSTEYLKTNGTIQTLGSAGNLQYQAISNAGSVDGINLSEAQSSYENYVNTTDSKERASDIAPVDPSNTSDSKFLVSSGINNRAYRELTFDDVVLSGTDFNFYDSESVYGTLLSGYESTTVGSTEVADTDSLLVGLKKLEQKIDTGGGTVNTKLYEDNIKANQVNETNGIYQSKYAIDSTNNNDIFISGYSIFSLPDPKTIKNGFNVTIKSDAGPVFIYPSYGIESVYNAPLIEGEHDQLVLTQTGGFARLEFENNSWRITDSDKISFSILKNDKPSFCPTGMVPIAGSYLLETDGFCIDQEFQEVKVRYQLSYDDWRNPVTGVYETTDMQIERIGLECQDIAASSLTAYSHIASMSQLLTVFQNAGVNDSLTFFEQLQEAPSACPSGTNFQSTQLDVDSQNYVMLRKHWEKIGSTCYASDPIDGISGVREIVSLQPSSHSVARTALLSNGICHDSALQTKLNATANFNNFYSISKDAQGLQESAFKSGATFHEKGENFHCGLNPFIGFSGVPEDTAVGMEFRAWEKLKASGLFGNSSQWPSDAQKVIYLDSSGVMAPKNLSIKFKDSKWNSYAFNNVDYAYTGGFKAVRCSWMPIISRCELPSVTTGYDVSACPASAENPLTISECSVQCASGYSSIAEIPPVATCNPPNGNKVGNFNLSGCVSEENLQNPPALSSCQSSEVSTSGFYEIDLRGNNNQTTENVMVFCDVSTNTQGQTVKQMDLIKTLGYAKNQGNLDEVASLFIRANNDSTLYFDVLANDLNQYGLYVQNLGENVNTDAEIKTSGFEIGQWGKKFDGIEMSYAMQGATHSDDRVCSDEEIGVPLNGPGFEGGEVDDYLSPTPPGYTYIQGSYDSDRDRGIQVTNYSATAFDPYTIFSFSGSGIDLFDVPECAKLPTIPTFKPATFFSVLKVRDTLDLLCTMPETIPDGYIVNCAGDNSDNLYSDSSCEISCDSGYVTDGFNPGVFCSAFGSEFIFQGCTTPENAPTEFYEPFNDAASFNQKFDVNTNKPDLIALNIENGNFINNMFNPVWLDSAVNGSYLYDYIEVKTKQQFTFPLEVEFLSNWLETSSLHYNLKLNIYGENAFNFIQFSSLYPKLNNINPRILNTNTICNYNCLIKLIINSDGSFVLRASDPNDATKLIEGSSVDLGIENLPVEKIKLGWEIVYPKNYTYRNFDEIKITKPDASPLSLTNYPIIDSSNYVLSGSGCTSNSVTDSSNCDLSCAASYYADSINPPQLVWLKETQNYRLTGCYDSPASTTTLRAERFIQDRSIIHVDANHAYDEVGNEGKIDYDQGEVFSTGQNNKFNKEHFFTPVYAGTSTWIPFGGEVGKRTFNFDRTEDTNEDGYINASDAPNTFLVSSDGNSVDSAKNHWKVFDDLNQTKYSSFIFYKFNSTYSYRHPMVFSDSIGGIGMHDLPSKGIKTYHYGTAALNKTFSANYPSSYLNNFHSYVGIYNGENSPLINEYKMYLDTEKVQFFTLPDEERNQIDEPSALSIGGSHAVSGNLYSTPFPGEIAQVIFFNEELTAEQIEVLHNYYAEMYGKELTPKCTMPADTTGYSTTCDNSTLKTASQCEAETTCATGYTDNENLHPFRLRCDSNGGEFELLGCYPLNQGDGDDPDIDDPTTEQLALRIIKENAIFYFDPDDAATVTTESDGRIKKISSKYHRPGTNPEMNPMDLSTSPKLESHLGKNMINFSESSTSVNDVLEVTGFNEIKPGKGITMISSIHPLTNLSGNLGTLYTYGEFVNNRYSYNYLQIASNKQWRIYNRVYRDNGMINSIYSDQSYDESFINDQPINVIAQVYSSPGSHSINLNGQTDYLDPVYAFIELSAAIDNVKLGNRQDNVFSSTYDRNLYGGGYQGYYGEFGFFDQNINDAQSKAISSYLNKKYGLVKSCSLPASTTGYNVAKCDTSRENLTTDECEITCASGYQSFSEISGITVQCTDNEDFLFHGCFPETGITNDDYAKNIIANKSVLALDAEDNVIVDTDNKVTSWKSSVNKNGERFELIRKGDNGPLYQTDAKGNKELYFSGNQVSTATDERLWSEEFDGLTGSTEFMRFFVYRPEERTVRSLNVLACDRATGCDGYFKLNSTTNEVHVASTYNNYFNYNANASEFYDGADKFHITSFDGAETEKLSALNIKLFGSETRLDQVVNSTVSVDPYYMPHSSVFSTYIGGDRDNYAYNAFQGAIKHVIYFDTLLNEQEELVVSSYLKKKSGLGKRCSIPGDQIFDIVPKEHMTEPDGFYFTDQVVVTCPGGIDSDFTTLPAVECANAGADFTIVNCE